MVGEKLLIRLAGAVLGVTLIAATLSAQQGGVPVDRVHKGSSLVALSNVPVRDHPPGGGALYVPGQQTGYVRSGETIEVSEEQIVSTLLGNQKWVYFSRQKQLSPSSGWVLVGKAGNTSDSFGAKR